ncbi:MAG: substrate-binding domain-containing protein [Planctomycetota bacterium]|nr:substrate-binding domain-containing protein [Planctomycetota bacterium]
MLLEDWLRQLPEPCGIMGAFDSLARRILDLCVRIGRKITDSIPVLGADDDPLLCQLASPPLTSVIPDAEQAGYVAAELLEKVMAGQAIPRRGTLLPPLVLQNANPMTQSRWRTEVSNSPHVPPYPELARGFKYPTS